VVEHAPARRAAAQYARALRFARGLPPAVLAGLLEDHAYECYLTDQLDQAAASREQALGCWRTVADRRREGDTLRWLSRLAWHEGRNADAWRAGQEAVELLEGLAPGPELARRPGPTPTSPTAPSTCATTRWPPASSTKGPATAPSTNWTPSGCTC
jgi:hypothetical protein